MSITIPAQMHHIAMEAPGGPEVLVLATGPVPRPATGEVLIRVAAAGINRPDVLQRTGNYPPPPGASPILGLEVSGTVVALGAEVTGWHEGDAVCALVAGGGYAEYCVAPAPQCLPVPKGVALVDAAGLPETFFTVCGPTSSIAAGSPPARAFSCMAGRAASARRRSNSRAPLARVSSRPPAAQRNAPSAATSAPSARSTTGRRILSPSSRKRHRAGASM